MKKLLVLLPMILLLAGCKSQETFETVTDVQEAVVIPAAQQIMVDLPSGTQTPVLQSKELGEIYFCDDYFITVQTVQSGDLNSTLRNCTGFDKEQLRLIQTQTKDLKRYECVWSAAGEGQEQVGRLCILDDGNYHYVLTTMADADSAGNLQSTWQELFDSMRLLPADVNLDTAS